MVSLCHKVKLLFHFKGNIKGVFLLYPKVKLLFGS
jgi:hypothetical protein